MKIIKEFFLVFKEAETSEKISCLLTILAYLLAIFMSAYLQLYETELCLRVLGLILAFLVFTSTGMIIDIIIMYSCEPDE